MTNQPNHRRSIEREAWIALVGAFCVLAAVAMATEAQEPPVARPKTEGAELPRRSSLVEGAYGLTRPGNPSDTVTPGGAIVPAVSFAADGLKKFKIMGATVYFAVFKNTGEVDGDTFGTGMANFDHRFHEGVGFQNDVSPKYDRRAKYLYLYQVVNDRGMERPETGKVNPIKPAIVDGKNVENVTPTEDIGSFALKLLVDPLYITSWGHFTDSGFASNVTELTSGGQIVKQVVAGKETEKENVIRLAVSYHPSIQAKISRPEYTKRARSLDLGGLANGFGVDNVNIGLKDTKVHQQLLEMGGQLEKKGIKLVADVPTVAARLKAASSAYLPDYVQMISMTNEERAHVSNVSPVVAGDANRVQDDITRAIFRVDWRKGNTMKQGGESVVFGFTTDLPPVAAPIRIDTPRAAQFSEGLRLINYFSDSGVERAIGAGASVLPKQSKQGAVKPQAAQSSDRFRFVSFVAQPQAGAGPIGDVIPAVGAEGAAAAIALGTSLGQAVTPGPPPAEVGGAGGGFAGVTGGVNSFGGNAPGGGAGGLGFPALGTIGSARGGSMGAGGGFGGGGGFPGSGKAGQGQTNQNSNVPSINFNATLTNNQQQQQNQTQTNNNGRNGCCHGGHGPVVPAPASLLLGLLGLPGLFFVLRRKPDATV